MPIHDWTRVRSNRFHHFHQGSTQTIAAALNAGLLPDGYFALTEQITSGPEPDVVALEIEPRFDDGATPRGGVAIRRSPPSARFVARSELDRYAAKSDRVTVRRPDGAVVAVIEIVSPGNKDSRHAMRAFTRKVAVFLQFGIHLLIVDLFPPNARNRQGIHKEIWDRIREEPFELPADKPLTLVAYSAGPDVVAYVDPVAVGEVLPDMPVFLTEDWYVSLPLESTYLSAWAAFPTPLKGDLEDSP